MREFIQRNVKSRRTGKIVCHKYYAIGGVPIQQYFRERARGKYVKRPRVATRTEEEIALASQIKELRSQGVTQCEIVKRLNVSRYRVQHELGVQ
jgi:hypothetical protein